MMPPTMILLALLGLATCNPMASQDKKVEGVRKRVVATSSSVTSTSSTTSTSSSAGCKSTPATVCIKQPDGYGPLMNPDTVAQFQAYDGFFVNSTLILRLYDQANCLLASSRNCPDAFQLRADLPESCWFNPNYQLLDLHRLD